MPKAIFTQYIRLVLLVVAMVVTITLIPMAQVSAASPAPTATPKPKFDWDRYKPNTIATLIKKLEPTVLSDPGLWLTKGEVAARIVVSYTGKLRNLSTGNKNLISWVKGSLTPKTRFFDAFTQEMLVVENGVEYWLPVQKQLISHFKKEVKPGSEVMIFISYFGANHSPTDHHVDWLFTINEFWTKQ